VQVAVYFWIKNGAAIGMGRRIAGHSRPHLQASSGPGTLVEETMADGRIRRKFRALTNAKKFELFVEGRRAI
jgi:hypothetical protein